MANIPSQEYERKHLTRFLGKFGDGKDGIVLKTDRRTAVKFLQNSDVYQRELRAYQHVTGAIARVIEAV